MTFENEVALIRAEFPGQEFEVVIPSLTIRADNPVAVVDKVVAKKGTADLARAYLEYHYSPEAQALFAANGVRPIDEQVLQANAARFPKLNVFTVEQGFGSWAQAQSVHFADGGLFDQLFAK